MCGISGIAGPGNIDQLRRRTQRMVDLMQHRGPDNSAIEAKDGIVLGHNRLSVIDLVSGDQPMSTEDGRYTIVFNGEIYNYRDLICKIPSGVLRTRSDTEVLLQLYAKFGSDCLEYLNGMFAFAIWDSQDSRLFIARDRIGVKPLYYRLEKSEIAFASELTPLTEEPRQLAIDSVEILNYLHFQAIPSPSTIYKEIRKLPAAHFGIWHDGKLDIHRYWNPWNGTANLQLSENEAIDQFRDLFIDAARIRTISDVPLGAFLSGGVDSSAVVAALSTDSREPVKTFSVGFEEADQSELDFARKVANRHNTDHHETIISSGDIPQAAERVVRQFGEPFGDSSAVPTYLVSKVAREKVTVALSGDGGDEFFGGYRAYRYINSLSRLQNLPGWGIQSAAAIAGVLYKAGRGSRGALKAARFLGKLNKPFAENWLSARSNLDGGSASRLLRADVVNELSLQWRSPIEELSSEYANFPQAERAMRVDAQTYLPDELLVKVDRASMATSLEVRSPFLDYRLIEFALTLPLSFKIRGSEGKWIVKKAMQDLVPREVMYRRKQGFGLPVREWFQHALYPYIRETLLESPILRNYLNRPALEATLVEHRNGVNNHAELLWALLILALWGYQNEIS